MDEPRDHVDDRCQRFYRDNFTQTARLARLLTNRPDVADDLAQDAFMRVCRYVQNADRPIDNPAALLRTTTVRPFSSDLHAVASALKAPSRSTTVAKGKDNAKPAAASSAT